LPLLTIARHLATEIFSATQAAQATSLLSAVEWP